MSIEMNSDPYNSGGSEIFSNSEVPSSTNYQDPDRSTTQRMRQSGQNAVRYGTLGAMNSVGDFFGVTQRSQNRLNSRHGERGVRTLRRREGAPHNNCYVDTNYMSAEFLGDIDIPIEFIGYQDGSIPPGKEHLFLRDKQEGLEFYKRVANLKIEDDGFFGGGGVTAPQGPGRGNLKIHAGKKPKSNKDKIKSKLKALPSFWPYFTIFIIILDVIAAVAPIIFEWASKGNIAPIHLVPISVPYETADYLTLGNLSIISDMSVYAGRSPNMWIGTSVEFLIQAGASYAPCMRREKQIVARYAADDERQQAQGGLGCCQKGSSAGTIVRSDCGGVFSNLFTCASSNITIPFPVIHDFRPCCVGIMGQCHVITNLHCQFLGGTYHQTADSCDDVNCFLTICGMFGTGVRNVPGFANRPDPSQWWRWITALFFHAGIIHLVVVCVETLIVAGLVEHTAGLIRVSLIYFICGIGGNMFGSILSPYAIQLGGSPAVMGLSAVFLVEYFENVQALKNRCVEFLRLLGVLTTIFLVNFILGTFPYVDNWANLGGFLFGIPSALIFLPYVTFGKWDAVRKRIVLAVTLPILIVMFLVLLVIFYFANTDFCPVCKYFSCIPYFDNVCSNAYNYPDPQTVYTT